MLWALGLVQHSLSKSASKRMPYHVEVLASDLACVSYIIDISVHNCLLSVQQRIAVEHISALKVRQSNVRYNLRHLLVIVTLFFTAT